VATIAVAAGLVAAVACWPIVRGLFVVHPRSRVDSIALMSVRWVGE
jgi:hypothetical protein